MKKGEVWWVNFPKPVGPHPAVLLSRDEACNVRNALTIAIITTKIRDLPVEVLLGKSDGLREKCVANMDTITTIPKGLLGSFITILSPEKIEQVNRAICFALDL